MRRLSEEEAISLKEGQHYLGINTKYMECYFKHIRKLEETETYIVNEVYIYYRLTDNRSYEKYMEYANQVTENRILKKARHIIFELTDEEVHDLILLETI